MFARHVLRRIVVVTAVAPGIKTKTYKRKDFVKAALKHKEFIRIRREEAQAEVPRSEVEQRHEGSPDQRPKSEQSAVSFDVRVGQIHTPEVHGLAHLFEHKP